MQTLESGKHAKTHYQRGLTMTSFFYEDEDQAYYERMREEQYLEEWREQRSFNEGGT